LDYRTLKNSILIRISRGYRSSFPCLRQKVIYLVTDYQIIDRSFIPTDI
jgi:hypothetical protein